mmetsp:Transcript_9560/g.13043  ORF Transcript_9560/g.13043 Transcript_9560/m.13043 type:complete len:155 (+) Transcript_9560:77-541(+)
MNKLLLLGISAIAWVPLYAQQNTVSTGGNATGTNGSVSFTVGQVDYSNAAGTDGSSNEGMQQPFEFFDPEASLQELEWNAQLFPNPTNDQVILALATVPEDARYQLIDSQGKLITQGVVNSTETHIDMRQLAPAVYHLQLIQNSATTSIQIIKN